MRFGLSVGLGLIVALMIVIPARADYFVKQDPTFRYTFSVPDQWDEVGGLSPRITHAFLAKGTDGAGCAIASETDTRFLNYTHDEMAVAVQREFNAQAFEVVTPRLNIGKNDALNVSVLDVKMGGLGDGFSNYAVVDYTDLSGPDKRAIIYGTIYGHMKLWISCQSRRADFERRMPQFAGVISSLDFVNFYRQYPTLYYRDFLGTERSLLEIWLSDLFRSIKNAFN